MSVWINGMEYDSESIVGRILALRLVYFWTGWFCGAAVTAIVVACL